MPKLFRVSADELLYYAEEEIEAETADEARAIYSQMMDDGELLVVNSDVLKINVDEHIEKII